MPLFIQIAISIFIGLGLGILVAIWLSDRFGESLKKKSLALTIHFSIFIILFRLNDNFSTARSGLSQEYYRWEVEKILDNQVFLLGLVWFLIASVFILPQFANTPWRKIKNRTIFALVVLSVISFSIIFRSNSSLRAQALEFANTDVQNYCIAANESLRKMNSLINSDTYLTYRYEAFRSESVNALDYYKIQIGHLADYIDENYWLESWMPRFYEEQIESLNSVADEVFIASLLPDLEYGVGTSGTYKTWFAESLECD